MGFLSFLLQIIIGVVIMRYVFTPIIMKFDYMKFIFPIIIYVFIMWLNESSIIGVIAAIISYFILFHFEDQQINKIKENKQNSSSATSSSKGSGKESSNIMANFDSEAWFQYSCSMMEENELIAQQKPVVKPKPQKVTISNTQGFRIVVDKVNKSIMRYGGIEWMQEDVKYWLGDMKDSLLFRNTYSSLIFGVQQLDDDIYVGELLNGRREGYGCYMWPNGRIVIGEWKGGKKDGDCVYADGKGYVEHCTYSQNKKTGWSSIRYSSGKTDRKWNK